MQEKQTVWHICQPTTTLEAEAKDA